MNLELRPSGFDSPVSTSQFPLPSLHFPVCTSRFPVCISHFLFSSLHFPVSSFQFPVSSFQFPVSNFQFPVSSFQFPIPSFQFPVSNHGTSRVSACGTISNVAGSVPTSSPSSSKRMASPATWAAQQSLRVSTSSTSPRRKCWRARTRPA